MKLSFVIPSYNNAAWVCQAVQSCLEQTYRDIEVIVVDDCSTDSTQQALTAKWVDPVLQAKKEALVRVLRNEKNLGRSASRNIGNQAATGDVILVLDADDLALPNRAKITAEKFGKGAQFLYGSAVQMDACGRQAGEIPADVFNKERALETLENRIVHSTTAYTKELALKFPYQGGDVARLGIDDWCFQTQLYMSGVRFDFVPNVLAAYRLLGSGISQTRKPEEVKAFKTKYLEAYRVTA